MTIKVTYEQGTGFAPRIVRIETTSTLSQVTTAGWLNSAVNNEGITILPSDKLLIYYGIGGTTGNSFFDVSIASGTKIITLSVAESDVILPVVSGNFASFSGTSGSIADLGYLPSNAAKTAVVMAGSAVVSNRIAHFIDTAGTIDDTAAAVTNAGDIYAGLDATAGALRSYPATTATGYLAVIGVSNGGAFNVTLSNASHGQTSVYSIPDSGNALGRFLVGATATPFVSGNYPVASGTAGLMVDSGIPSNRVLYTSFATPDVSINLVRFDITVTAAALASAASVTLQASSGSKQYKIVALWANSGGTNFSGGGGDRLLSINDGTTVYSLIPAASLGTLVNAGWGISAALPFPAAAAINTSTVAAQALKATYSGGTADYGAGSVVLSGILQRVA